MAVERKEPTRWSEPEHVPPPDKFDIYRVLPEEEIPRVCGTCEWFYRDENDPLCFVEATIWQSGKRIVAWGSCDRWEKADD